MTDGTNASQTKKAAGPEEHSALDRSPPTKFVEIDKEDRNCYLTFNQIDLPKYRQVIKYRDELHLHLRFAYFFETETLIIKIPDGEHEEAHANFSCTVIKDAFAMGIFEQECWLLGAKRQTRSISTRRKEIQALQTASRVAKEDTWPIFVIEARNSESLDRLKADANWWLQNSAGKVLMVILIKVNKRQSTIQIPKYIPIPIPIPNPMRVVLPSLTADNLIDISVVPPQVQGARSAAHA